jgi:hypothetical protein
VRNHRPLQLMGNRVENNRRGNQERRVTFWEFGSEGRLTIGVVALVRCGVSQIQSQGCGAALPRERVLKAVPGVKLRCKAKRKSNFEGG